MDKRRKELLFLGAGLAVLLIALYLTFKPTTPAAQATTQAPAAALATKSPPAKAMAQIRTSAVPIPMSEGGTTPGRNPFTPVIAARSASAPAASPPVVQLASVAPSLPPLRPLPLSPLLGGQDGPSTSGPLLITPGRPGQPAEASLVLTGIIYGDPSIAILRKGEKRYFVRPGDPVGSRYVVQSISRRRVVLASSQETLSLDLTGRL